MADCQTKVSNEPSADAQSQHYEFVGWVPTANGRLSFRHVGEARHPSVCHYSNVGAPSSVRFIVAHQRRDLNDFLFAGLIKRFVRKSGVFHFLLVCRSGPVCNKLDSLAGQVLVFLPSEKWKGIERDLSQLINTVNDRRVANGYSDVEMQREFQRAQALVEGAADLTIDFLLWRDGQIHLSQPRFLDSDIRENSVQYAKQSGATFLKWAADQAYFFIRDLCHVHQHHENNVDTIMTLQSIADTNWRDHIIYSLHNYIIRLRRGGRPSDLYRANGVLAYAQSFEGICRARDEHGDFIVYNAEPLRASIDARLGEMDYLSSVDANIRNWSVADSVGYRSMIIGIFGVVVTAAIVMMQPVLDQNKDSIIKLDKTIAANWQQLGGGLILCFILSLIMSDEAMIRRHIYKKNRFYAKDFAALGVARARAVGAFFLALAIMLAGLAAYLIYLIPFHIE